MRELEAFRVEPGDVDELKRVIADVAEWLRGDEEHRRVVWLDDNGAFTGYAFTERRSDG